MVLKHGIVCSSNPQRPRDGRRCGGKMLWFVKTQTTEKSAMNTKVQLLLTDVANGLYHYDISFLDGQQTQGKLLIQKK